MMISSSGADEFGNTGLENLTDTQLIEYADILHNLPKRDKDIVVNNYDTKASYHLVRLILEAEQILTEHDLDLERNREILKSIRRGEWELNRLKDFFTTKEKSLEAVYAKSTLRDVPDEQEIKALLLSCLEMHYGRLDRLVATPSESTQLLDELQALIDRHR